VLLRKFFSPAVKKNIGKRTSMIRRNMLQADRLLFRRSVGQEHGKMRWSSSLNSSLPISRRSYKRARVHRLRVLPFSTPSDKDDKRPKLHASKEQPSPSPTWVDIYLPESVKPYAQLARVDKPIGTWLLLWPCFWSTALASSSAFADTSSNTAVSATFNNLPDPSLLALFAAGAFVMRGAGCTLNDLWDREIDTQVPRTASRPLASGRVTVPQALVFLTAQLTAGLGVLVSLPHTWDCIQWGMASMPLVVAYPLMKRFFPYPQLVLGLTFNWGAFMGWVAVHGGTNMLTDYYSIILPLYGSGVTWTLVYDTIYAHQDKESDRVLGLQTTALSFGSSDVTQKRVLYALATATWLQWQLVGHAADLNSDWSSFGSAIAYGHLLWQIQSANFDDPDNLAARFRSNSTVGAIMFTTFLGGTYFA
jgi:4-hydroxybenzoate polyprenyltransferase